MELDFVSEEQIREKTYKMIKSLNVLKTTNAFLHWLEEHKGHEKIDAEEIMELAIKFLDLKEIEHSEVYIETIDDKTDEESPLYYHILQLNLNIKDDFSTFDEIGLYDKIDDKLIGGYYDELFKINWWLKDENVKRYNDNIQNNINSIHYSYAEYNKYLNQAIQLKNRMGF